MARLINLSRVCLLVCFSLIIPGIANAGYVEATSAFSKGQYAPAFDEFHKLAESGHQGAEFMLGVMYFQGEGIGRNKSLAAVWFHKSALKGHKGAQLAFGSIHIRGVGVNQDLYEAYRWLSLALASPSKDISSKADLLLRDTAQLMTPDEISSAKQSALGFAVIKSGLTTFN